MKKSSNQNPNEILLIFLKQNTWEGNDWKLETKKKEVYIRARDSYVLQMHSIFNLNAKFYH